MQTDIYLGIDFGLARIGLAVSRASLAEPIGIIANNDMIWDELDEIAHREGVTKIVVGLSEKEMAEKSHQFGETLAAKLGIPVAFVDETLSSVTSHQKLAERSAQAGKQKYKGHVDHFAAAELLQEYLDFGEQK